MKKLTEQINLQSFVETISMMDLRMQPGEVLDKVMYGQTIIIERNGRPLAMLVPYISRDKPTIVELEKILASEDKDIQILPNGEIRRTA